MTDDQLAIKADKLLQGGIDDLLEKIILDIALEMVHQKDDDERDELYRLANAVKCLKRKIQEYSNNIESQEIYNE